jgi:site-specific recombinase XerD
MIALRYKKLNSGEYSIYLDISGKDETGKPFRQYDFLKIHVSRDYSKSSRVLAIDKEKMDLAGSIRAKKELELNGSINSTDASNRRVNLSLYGFIEAEYQKTKRKSYRYLIKNLKDFTDGKELLLSDIDIRFIERFTAFLDKTLARNTRIGVLTELKKFFNLAYNQELITLNPFKKFKMQMRQEGNISHLEMHELQKLKDTSTNINPHIRQAFLFSCFTGLRFSDLLKLKWSHIHTTKDKDGNDYTTMILRPSKTTNTSGKLLQAPLAKQALQILEEVGHKTDGDLIFYTLKSSTSYNDRLKDWAKAAEISKNLHSHVGRHTFATLGLTSGIDIYTVSKMLGHSELKLTERYAKVIDKKKQLEVQKFPSFSSLKDKL